MTQPLRSILVVEDDHDIQMVVSLALRDLGGYEVEVCSSGVEALDIVMTMEPDLILLDVMMPRLDGPGTLNAMRENPRIETPPVVFMTAKAQPQEVAEYREMGALEVIIKPFDPIHLSDLIEKIWSEYTAA